MKSKKNKMKLSRKKNNIKANKKTNRGGSQARRPNHRHFNTRLRESLNRNFKNNIQSIQEQMSEDAQINEILKQDYMTKLAYFQQIQRNTQLQQEERKYRSEQLRIELENLRIFLEQRIKDYANKEDSLRNWVNKTLPLLETASEEN